MDIVVSIKSLAFTYQNAKEPSIRGINGEIGDGEFLMIMGHGGAGKSTLCCAMNGIVPRFYNGEYSGNVFIAGKQTTQYNPSDMAKRVGLVLQDFEAQLFSTNVELEIAFGLENIGLPSVEINRRIDRYLDLIGLNGMRKVDIYTLSGGQKQRLLLARALAGDPDILLLDDSSSALDYKTDSKLREGIRLHCADATKIIIAQRVSSIENADQIIVLDEGKIMGVGTSEELLATNEIYREVYESQIKGGEDDE